MPSRPPQQPPPAEGATVTGVLERILFHNEENAYCIAEVRESDSRRLVTVVGPMPGVQCGETLAVNGEWVRHPKHGEQLKVASFRSQLPASVNGIRKYLGSGLIHGIGEAYAAKIVDHFGEQTLEVISEQSARLREVPGIGKQRAESIKKAWDEQRAVRDVMVFLQTYGVTASQCLRLVRKYGNGAKHVLRSEPYRLAEDIERIGFRTADKIALNLGFSTDSKERIDAGILHAVGRMEDDGHTLAPEPALVEAAAELLGVPAGKVLERLHRLVDGERLEPIRGGGATAYQLPRLAAAEATIAAAVTAIAAAPSGMPPIRIDRAVAWAQQQAGFSFGDLQQSAVAKALASKVSVITGGPGTGKTTILRAVVAILRAKAVRVLLASPTGRAAQRLAEAAAAEASTIHRLLQYDPATRGFVHTANNPLPCDFLIVDETSMLDVKLAARLFAAVPPSAHLLLVGDADQLPSVGPGNVLDDLVGSPQVTVTRLDTIFRQNHLGEIVATAHRILGGDADPGPVVTSLRDLDPERDLQFVECADADRCLEAIAYLARDFVPRRLSLDPLEQLQVIAPMHRGTVGIEHLNHRLQEVLNPAGKQPSGAPPPGGQRHFRERTGRPGPVEIEYGSLRLRVGDKVIQVRNNYDKGVFNGDIGRVASVKPDSDGIYADFGGNSVDYGRGELSELQLAYAISIHKSQGSEYPAVILPLLKQHFVLLQRNLIYTAITRAREKVILVGERAAYEIAVGNAERAQRRTYLRERLAQAAAAR